MYYAEVMEFLIHQNNISYLLMHYLFKDKCIVEIRYEGQRYSISVHLYPRIKDLHYAKFFFSLLESIDINARLLSRLLNFIVLISRLLYVCYVNFTCCSSSIFVAQLYYCVVLWETVKVSLGKVAPIWLCLKFIVLQIR